MQNKAFTYTNIDSREYEQLTWNRSRFVLFMRRQCSLWSNSSRVQLHAVRRKLIQSANSKSKLTWPMCQKQNDWKTLTLIEAKARRPALLRRHRLLYRRYPIVHICSLSADCSSNELILRPALKRYEADPWLLGGNTRELMSVIRKQQCPLTSSEFGVQLLVIRLRVKS